MTLENIHLKMTALGQRVVIARTGKRKDVALEQKDVMSEFLQTIVQYAFNGRMPEPGEAVEVDFGGGNEQFLLRLTRKEGSV